MKTSLLELGIYQFWSAWLTHGLRYEFRLLSQEYSSWLCKTRHNWTNCNQRLFTGANRQRTVRPQNVYILTSITGPDNTTLRILCTICILLHVSTFFSRAWWWPQKATETCCSKTQWICNILSAVLFDTDLLNTTGLEAPKFMDSW